MLSDAFLAMLRWINGLLLYILGLKVIMPHKDIATADDLVTFWMGKILIGALILGGLIIGVLTLVNAMR